MSLLVLAFARLFTLFAFSKKEEERTRRRSTPGKKNDCERVQQVTVVAAAATLAFVLADFPFLSFLSSSYHPLLITILLLLLTAS